MLELADSEQNNLFLGTILAIDTAEIDIKKVHKQ